MLSTIFGIILGLVSLLVILFALIGFGGDVIKGKGKEIMWALIFLIVVAGLLAWGSVALLTKEESKNEPVKQEAVNEETDAKDKEEAKAKKESDEKAKIEAKEKAEAEAKAKAEAEAKKEAENLVAVVHLDDVKDLPKYTIETYKNGDEMPAANGSTMNCTYPTCYRVTFDVNGSGQNPTAEYNSLRTKLEDRSILDNSYDGPELATIKADYWTKDGMITARFYK